MLHGEAEMFRSAAAQEVELIRGSAVRNTERVNVAFVGKSLPVNTLYKYKNFLYVNLPTRQIQQLGQ